MAGSLGQGLPDGVGIGLAGRYLDRPPHRVWVPSGDSELAEGSIWEALDKASHYGLSIINTFGGAVIGTGTRGRHAARRAPM